MVVIIRPRPPVVSTVSGSGSTSSSSDVFYVQPAGADNVNDPSIAPFLGRNTGSYYPNRGSNASDTSLPPIPREWIIAPLRYSDQLGDCPTGGDTIRAFLLAEIVAAIVVTVICCRPLLYKLSCGRLGQLRGRGVYWSWIVCFAFELLPNVFSSLVVVRTDGYEQLSMVNVFALYASRPRIKAWWLAILRILVAVRARRFSEKAATDELEHLYVDGYIGSAIAEQLLQIIAAAFIGTTWKAFPNEPIKAWMQSSLNYMMVVPGITLITILWVVPIWRRSREAWAAGETVIRDPQTGARTYEPHGHPLHLRICIICVAAPFLAVIQTAPWIYWTRFLHLPGSLWCPPALATQATIWAIFSSLASVISSSA